MRANLGRSGVPFLAILLLSAGSLAAPGGLYSGAPPAPAASSDAPEVREQGHAVSADGSVSYSVPFTVPPGRGGAQPSVGLSYSSRAPLRGGIAAGWSLPIPTISVDTSYGRLQGLHYQVEGKPLLMVDEPKPGASSVAFRADGDGDYTRYEHVADGSEAGFWRALDLDGSVSVYGDKPGSRDERTEGSSQGAGVYGGQGRWFLRSYTDPHGNLVEYTYETVFGTAQNGNVTNTPIDVSLRRIEYGRNVNDPASVHHAKVELEWEATLAKCPGSNVPIGAQFSYRTGIRRYEGARKLFSLSAWVLSSPGGAWVERRRMNLTYDASAASCSAAHAPLRQLTYIQERAWGPTDLPSNPSVVLPITTFSYGPLQYAYDPVHDGWRLGISAGKNPLADDKPGGWPTRDQMLMDLDGSGVPERVEAPLCDSLPQMPWANGSSPGDDGPPFYKRQWEGCSLAAQVTHRATPRNQLAGNPGDYSCGTAANFYGYQFMDVNGDGRPDLIAALDYQKGGYRPTEDPAVAADYPACAAMPTPPCRTSLGDPVACLFAPDHQRVWPMDTSYGPGGIGVYMVAPGQGSAGASAIDASAAASGLGGAGAAGDPGVVAQPTGVGGAGGTGGGSGSGGAGGGGDGGAGGQDWQCPQPTCNLRPLCIGGNEVCCSEAYCAAEPGAPTDPPTPDPFWNSYRGNPGGHVYETEGVPPPPNSAYCGYVPDLHCGWYVYRVFLNESDGSGAPVFDPTPHLVRSPVPIDGLEMSSDGGLGPMANASAWRAIVDLDGNDRPDAIYQRPNGLHGTFPEALQVWLGSESGVDGYQGKSDGTALRWSMPPSTEGKRELLDANDELIDQRSMNAQGDLVRYFHTDRERVSLHDINGDGLLDLVRREVGGTSGGLVRVFYNTGSGFEEGPGTVLSTTLPAMSRRVRWTVKRGPPQEEVELSIVSARPVDLDGDGITDVVQLPEPGPNNEGHLAPLGPLSGSITAYYSTGDSFVPADVTAQLGAYRAALSQVSIAEGQSFRTLTDFLDDDGDGQPDMLLPPDAPGCNPDPVEPSYDFCGLLTHVHHAQPQPLHLLRKVENGLGGRVELTYAAMGNGSVVSRDGAHQRIAPLWVASASSVGMGSTVATTEYEYQNPVFGPDREGRFGFRGFETVVQTGAPVASGERGRTYTEYRYDLDEEGLVDRQLTALVLAGGGGERLEAVDETVYQTTPLFDSRLRVYQVAETIASTCGTPVIGPAPASVPGCIADPLTGVARNVSDWSPQAVGAANVAWTVSHMRRLPTRADSTVGVRYQKNWHELAYSATEYRLLNTAVQVDSDVSDLSRLVNTFDAAGNPVETSIWIDATTVATTKRTYDSKGNLTSVVRPNHYDTASQLAQTIEYDAFGLFPERLTNELGQETFEVHDVGTGAVLVSRGVEQLWGEARVTENRIDGLGRVVLRSEGVDFGSYDTIRKVFGVDYVDLGARSVTTYTLLEEPVEVWMEDATYLDALGRVVQEEQRSAAGDRVVTRDYDAAGHLLAVHVPGPGSTGTLTFATEYDGLGRVVRTTSPLEAPVDTAYQGLTTTVTRTSTDGTPSSQKTLVSDAFGRLVSVSDGLAAPAVTTYAYDQADRVVGIVDADGIATSIAYDMRGLRTQITRGAATIGYTYDVGGNRTEVVHPTGGAPFDPARHISSWKYDELDRLVESWPARLDLDDQQVERYGSGNNASLATTYSYDDPSHSWGIGRLTHVATPAMTIDFEYTSQGGVEQEWQSFTIAPDGAHWKGTAAQKRSYGIAGQIVAVHHPEATTSSHYLYDDRGRPVRVDTHGSGLSTPAWAEVEHDAAGYLTHRHTPVVGVEQQWTRDGAGRVSITEVHGTWGCALPTGVGVLASQGGCALSTIAGEALTFDSLGRVGSTSELGQAIGIQYGYDERGQIVSASAPSAAYQAAFTYTPGGRVQSASVQSALPGAEVQGRNVEHDYTPHGVADLADPAAVRALRDVVTDEEIATLIYDPRGNLTEKTAPDGNWSFVYDGENHLREVVDGKGNAEVYYYDHTGERVLTYRKGGKGGNTSVRHRIGGAELFHEGYQAGAERWTVDVSLGAAPVLRVGRKASGTWAVEHLFHGVLGSLLASVDEMGQGSARFGYGPFGEVLYGEGASVEQFDRRFNGKPEDEISGLRYYGARYYDPLTLSWTQADPFYRFKPEAALAEPLRQALYTFSLNNPLSYVDPDGLDSRTPTQAETDKLCGSPSRPCGKRKAPRASHTISATVDDPGKPEKPGEKPGSAKVTFDFPANGKQTPYDVYLVDKDGNYIPGSHGRWKYWGESFERGSYSVDHAVAAQVGPGTRAVLLEFDATLAPNDPALPKRRVNVTAVRAGRPSAGVTVRTDYGTDEGSSITAYAEIVIVDADGHETERWAAFPVQYETDGRAGMPVGNYAYSWSHSDLRLLEHSSYSAPRIQKAIDRGRAYAEISAAKPEPKSIDE